MIFIETNSCLTETAGAVNSFVTNRRTLGQLVCCHHLHVEVFSLRLPSGFDEPLEDLQGDNSTLQKQELFSSSIVVNGKN